MPAQNGESQGWRRRLWVGVAGLLVVILVAGAVGFLIGQSSGKRAAMEAAAAATSSSAAASAAVKKSRLEETYDGCYGAESDSNLQLTDGGQTIVVDTGSQYGSTRGMNCVLITLETPESIKARISSTTAMMGVQDAEHDGLHYSWSYHPDNGVDMVITAVD
jgi:hypothetical protein